MVNKRETKRFVDYLSPTYFNPMRIRNHIITAKK